MAHCKRSRLKIWLFVKNSTQKLTRVQKVDLNSDTLKKNQFKILHVEIFLNQNPTRCEKFNSKSDTLSKF